MKNKKPDTVGVRKSFNESTTVEWKQSVAEINEIIETAAAFANTEGGRIFIGLSPEGKVLGVQVGKGTIEKLVNQIAQHTDPKLHPKISVKKVEGKDVIVIEVKELYDRLVLAFGRPYKRVGKSSPKMSKDEYERLILEKHKDKLYFDEQICKGAKITDISKEKLSDFVKKAKEQRGLSIAARTSASDILRKLKLMKDGKLTNAAILLFGKDTQTFFLQSELKAIRFKGVDETKPMLDFKTIGGDAIREALANALAHRDYSSPSKVQVRIFDDRLEIWNPGLLPPPLTLEKLKGKHDSIPRNPLIAKAFFWVKFAEDVGSGTSKIIQWCKEWGLPEPTYEEAGGSFVTVFHNPKPEETQGMVEIKVGEKVGEKLSSNQRKILEIIFQNSMISAQELAKMVGISQRKIEKI